MQVRKTNCGTYYIVRRFFGFSLRYTKKIPIHLMSSSNSWETCFFTVFWFHLGLDHFARTSFSATVESLIFRIKDVIFDGLHSEYTNWTYHATALTHYKALYFEKKGWLKNCRNCSEIVWIFLWRRFFYFFWISAIPVFVIWGVMTVSGCLIQYNWTAKETSEGSCCPQCSTFSKSDYA